MKRIIEEFKKSKEAKAVIENIKEMIEEKKFYTIEGEEMKEILRKCSFDIERDGKLIKTLIHNIIKKYGDEGIGITKYVECGNFCFDIESDNELKYKETLIDILEELVDIPIIRETWKYLNINKGKDKKESGIFVDWEKHFREEERKNKEWIEQLIDVKTKYVAMKMAVEKTAPSEREYSKREIKTLFEIFKKRDLKKAQEMLTEDPSLIFIRDENDTFGSSILTEASRDGWIEGVELLLDLGVGVDGFIEVKDNDGCTPLIWASSSGRLEVVEYLIERGANVEAKSWGGTTPLMYAIFRGHLEVVEYLIERGANIGAKDIGGRTPLIWASNYGRLEVVKYLIEKGANIEAQNNQGFTPLIAASFRGHLEVVKYLIEKGANIEAKNNEGNTALSVSMENRNKEVEKYLKSIGIKE